MTKLSLIVTICFLSACVREQAPVETVDVAPATPAPTASASMSPTPTPIPEKIDNELQTELAKAVEPARGKVGVGAVLLETNDAAYIDRTGHYPMQSVYKLPIAMAVLKMVDEGKVRLDQEEHITPDDFVRVGFYSPIRSNNPNGVVMQIGEILKRSISESDGTASDVLLDLAGGPSAVMSYLKGIGVNDLIVADSEKSISKDWETQYRNWSTPEASIKLLRAIHERRAGLSEQTTNLLINVMTETETGGQRLKRAMPENASLAHKTGTGGTERGITGATNDIGIITLPDGRHILIAVYVSDSPAGTGIREKVIADVARTVIAKWSPESYPANQNTNRGSNSNRRS